MENAQIAAALDEIADLLEIREANQFRIRAYRDAARTVRDLSERLADRVANDSDLSRLPNIGKSTADKIRELVQTGTCKRLEELRTESAGELTELLEVPGLGPKKVKALHAELGVENLNELKQAAENEQVREVEGMGPKTERAILEGIEHLQEHAGRIRLKEAAEYVELLGRHLDNIDGIDNWQIAGSFRRQKETVGDLDVVVQAADRGQVADRIADHESVADVIGKGHDKVRVRLANGLNVDFLFFEQPEFGSAMLYFTGSKAHNIKLRKWAREKDRKLNEHGLFKGKKRLAGETEQSVYRKFGLPWIPPELREDRGEIEAACKDQLPTLLELDDIRGDLHAHTNESDGSQTIDEMAQAAIDRGYDYLALTDHSKAVHVANGLDEDRLRKHADRIRAAGSELSNFTLLAGVEVDIMKRGDLDLDDKILADLDWVNASIHSHFRLSQKDMTERVLAAIRSGVVHCIGHPLGRQIGTREPIQLDLDRIFEACVEHNVCLEINSYPDRLDLPDIHCQRAREAGVKFVISTDAHKIDDLAFICFGVSVARRGWLEKKDVLNTSTIRTLRKHAG